MRSSRMWALVFASCGSGVCCGSSSTFRASARNVRYTPDRYRNGEPLKRRRANGNNFSNRFPQIVAALTVLPVRSSQRRRLFCRFSDQTPALKCVMTDNLHRTCPHCGGKNTSYFIGIEESVWFTTKYETANGLVLFACSDTNRHKCPNLPKLESACVSFERRARGAPARYLLDRSC